jgi:hypothetical protein
MLVVDDPYIQQAYISLSNVVLSMRIVSLSYLAILALLVLALFRYQLAKNRIQQFLFICFGLSFMPFFIWEMSSFYYYWPVEVCGVLVGAILFDRFIQNKQRLSFSWLGVIAYLILILHLTPQSVQIGLNLHQRYLEEGALVEFVLSNDWTGYQVYSAISHFEKNHKLFVYFSDWSLFF